MTELEVAENNYLDFEKLSEAYTKKTGIEPVFMAAHDGTNVELFRESLVREVKKQHIKMYPHYLEDEVIDMSLYKDLD
jgi:GTPase